MKAIVTERAWQDQVLDLAHVLGWQSYHPHRSDHSAAGWPDLALCRPPRLILAELKTESGRLSTAQEIWLTMLSNCDGIEVYVWRPSEFDEVRDTLTGHGRFGQ